MFFINRQRRINKQEPLELIHETEHCKAIINGLLYDTEKATGIVGLDGFYVTPNKRFFEADIEKYHVVRRHDEKLVQIIVHRYCNIQPIDKDELKRLLGKYNAQIYIEMFGEVEEA